MTDNNSEEKQAQTETSDQAPTPPITYNPYQQPTLSDDSGRLGEYGDGPQTPLSATPTQNPPIDQAEVKRIRSYATASQIMAIVSLFIGGVILSSAALIVGIIGLRKANERRLEAQDERIAVSWEFIGRSAKTAIVLSAIALALNVAMLMLLYPVIVEVMQTGDMSQVFGGGSSATKPSVWG